MNKITKLFAFAFAVVLVMASPVLAQGTSVAFLNSGAIGAGLVALGAAYGIGKLASSSVESMARQPEVAGQIFPAMIVAAALIEGFTFYAIFVCSSVK